MRFWRNNKEKARTSAQQVISREDVLAGLNLLCAYFERNSQNNTTFRPEFETSGIIYSILEAKQVLTVMDVTAIVKLIKDMDEVEHYDGSGWLDYKIRLSYFLRLSGFDVNLFE
ncbi:MAG: hypothetical protein KF746_05455 [Chitinophagaceae bacterium]|nr:hypothetical protein [Chitinophagaceae bacterium]